MKRGAEGQEAKRARSQWLAVIREAAGEFGAGHGGEKC